MGRLLTPEQKARRAARDKVYYEAHKIDVLVRTRAYREAHRAELAAQQKSYRDAHRAELTAGRRAHYEAHRAEVVASRKSYRDAHRAEAVAQSKAYYEAHRAEIAAQRSAQRKGWSETYRAEALVRSKAYGRKHRNRRRAERKGCEIAPDVSAGTYARIMAGDPACTYCPAPATHVDHIWPFDLYGAETDANLVPACGSCNSGKKAKRLTEWEWARVQYGAAHSPKVAAELARLVAAH
ncbi:MAG TPA: HNH endonuclease [Dermatophilaceae bacterium]